MRSFYLLFLFAVLASCAIAPAFAAPDLHDVTAAYAAYTASQQDDYKRFDAAYREAIAAKPDDVALGLAHCDFIRIFAYSEESEWADTAQSDYAACDSELEKRWPHAPEVRVHKFESLNGPDAIKAGEALWLESTDWNASLRVRIATRLHYRYQFAKRPIEAGRYAVIAARLDGKSLVPEAIAELVRRGDGAAALQLSRSAKPSTNGWTATRQIDALAKLEDKSIARSEMDRMLATGIKIQPLTRIKIYLATGDLADANRAASELRPMAFGEVDRQARFDLAMANNKPDEAARYVRFRDQDPKASPQRYAVLARKAPSQLFSATLLPATMYVLFVILMLPLMPGLLLVPAHYRGLVLRLRGRQPAPLFERVGLRHAWIGFGVMFLVPVILIWYLHPELLGDQFAGLGNEAIDSQFDLYALSTGVCLACVAPFLLLFGRAHLFGERSQVKRTLGMIVLAWFAVVAVGVVTAKLRHAIGSDVPPMLIKAGAALVHDGQLRHGILVTLFLTAIVVPIYEELIFRGLLLGGLSRHIGFRWANALQALLFALCHNDAPRFVFYLAMGLAAGWLVRRNRTLWPSMVFHGLNNTFVGLVFMLGQPH